MISDPKYIVAQIGARRSYAVPEILDAAGLLSGLYTDICGNVGLGRVLALAQPVSSTAARLGRRRVPQQLVSRTTTFPLQTTLHACRERLIGAHPTKRFRAHLQWQLSMGTHAGRIGFGPATHLFSMLGEFPRLIAAAKQHGLAVVSEVYIALSAEQIVSDERRHFRSWEPEDHALDSVRADFPAANLLLGASDFFICPSESVRDDLVIRHAVPIARTAIVPYGVNPRWLELTPACQRGRVLFVGSAGLRKGIHYLGMAAESLTRKNGSFDFRVVGDVTAAVAGQAVCRHLNFIGRVPRHAIHTEFEAADLFVLPTLAEGSAEVTYEALAAGLPVITTKAAGSVVRDGIEGRIVPERNPEALADAILELTQDRALRARMSIAARQRAREFTVARYGERLLLCLRALKQ